MGRDGDGYITLLQTRFEANTPRHKGIQWADVEARLKASPAKWKSLRQMEETGGEPDVVGQENSGEFLFFDCVKESPSGRRSLCYDQAALDSRKQHKPGGSADSMANAMGIELLTEEQYRFLQTLGEFDLKTSSWVMTPPEIRKRGGSIFCDRRYDHVFTYHNGAESYYASRGFRGVLRV
ncbi:MAG: DUF4256 domain-containing protein [Fimbriimonadaceae bacterium]|nr:DUF4256 domain-containing protein [Fimbriimonadaceae bacterium]